MSALPSLIGDFVSASSAVGEDKSLELIMDSATLIEPSPIQFSFNTPGWYLAEIVLFIFVILLIVRWVIRYRKNAYRREAIKILNSNKIFEESDDLAHLLETLKLVAITTYGRDKVANLSGKDWFKFLELSSKKASFAEVEESVLSAYYKDEKLDNDSFQKLLSISKTWIQTHA